MEYLNLLFTGDEVLIPYIILILLCGIFLSIKLKFPQIRLFFLSIKIFSGAMDHKGSKGQLIHSQALFAGTGSSLLVGAVLGSLIAYWITGNFGILFWIWMAGILIMPIRFVASLNAVKFRTKLPSGRYLSGPMYFIEKALKARWLAVLFSICSMGVVLVLGGALPSMTVTYISDVAFGIKGIAAAFALAGIIIYIVLGGIRRIGRISGYFAPIGIFLFLVGLYLYVADSNQSFKMFLSTIFSSAFSPETMSNVKIYLYAIAIFYLATETGLGKSAGISGTVRTDSPVKQGLVSMLSTFIESFVISTAVFYLIYCIHPIGEKPTIQSLHNFTSSYTGLPSVLLFSSIIILCIVSVSGWFYAGEQSAYYIMGERFSNFYKIIFISSLLVSAYLYSIFGAGFFINTVKAAYTLAVFATIPVLISLLLLGKPASLDLNKYISDGGARYEILKDFYLLVLSALPKNLLSKLFGLLSSMRLPRYFMVPILKAFSRVYKINVGEAEYSLKEYNSLNQFFTRALKAGARIVDSEENAVVSPVDARISHFGNITKNSIIQAKGIDYNLKELIGVEKYVENFSDGKFITFYLSPQDYHRIHSPFYSRILGYYYEPGKLFPVNELAVFGIKGLFPKNERLITFLQTEYGKIAMVKVGASNVGKIRVTYDNKIVTNSWIRFSRELDYKNVEMLIQKGAELGRFEMGSTVILLFENDTFEFSDLVKDAKILYGTTIGFFKNKLVNLPK